MKKDHIIKALTLTSILVGGIFCNSAMADSKMRKCKYIEGPKKKLQSFYFKGQTAYLDGVEMHCDAIPVSFSTFRELPDVGSLPIGFTCNTDGGGIYSQLPAVVQVYTGGWKSNLKSTFALLEETLYRCD